MNNVHTEQSKVKTVNFSGFYLFGMSGFIRRDISGFVSCDIQNELKQTPHVTSSLEQVGDGSFTSLALM